MLGSWGSWQPQVPRLCTIKGWLNLWLVHDPHELFRSSSCATTHPFPPYPTNVVTLAAPPPSLPFSLQSGGCIERSMTSSKLFVNTTTMKCLVPLIICLTAVVNAQSVADLPTCSVGLLCCAVSKHLHRLIVTLAQLFRFCSPANQLYCHRLYMPMLDREF